MIRETVQEDRSWPRILCPRCFMFGERLTRRTEMEDAKYLEREVERLRATVRELESKMGARDKKPASDGRAYRSMRSSRPGSYTGGSVEESSKLTGEPWDRATEVFRDSAAAYLDALEQISDAMFSFADAILRTGRQSGTRQYCMFGDR